MNSAYNGPPMTLGNAAAARVRFIVWCLDCHHQIEPDPGEMAERHGRGDHGTGLARAIGLRSVLVAAGRHGRERNRSADPPERQDRRYRA